MQGQHRAHRRQRLLQAYINTNVWTSNHINSHDVNISANENRIKWQLLSGSVGKMQTRHLGTVTVFKEMFILEYRETKTHLNRAVSGDLEGPGTSRKIAQP